MYFSTPFFLSFLVVSVVCNVITPRSAPQIEKDIVDISAKIDDLAQAVIGLSDHPSYVQVLGVGTQSLRINSMIVSATRDVKSTGPLSSSDSSGILKALTAIGYKVVDLLENIQGKQPAIASTGLSRGTALILTRFRGSTDDFANALIAIAFDADKAEGEQLKNEIDAQFASTITRFS